MKKFKNNLLGIALTYAVALTPALFVGASPVAAVIAATVWIAISAFLQGPKVEEQEQ